MISSQLGIIYVSYKVSKFYCQNHLKSKAMEILAIIWPIGFATCEELRVGHKLNIVAGEKSRLYKNIEFNHSSAVRNTDPNAKTYTRLHKDIEQKEAQLVNVTKMSTFVSLAKTMLEGYPQAVVAISLLFLSIEYPSIRSWLTQNLNAQFDHLEIVFITFMGKTLFCLVNCVIHNR